MKNKNNRTTYFGFNIPEELKKKIKNAANERETFMSTIAIEALEQYFGKGENDGN